MRNTKLKNIQLYWSNNIANQAYECHVMYIALQIANYMGFKNVYLVGTDLGIGLPNAHMIFNTECNPNHYTNDDSGAKKYFEDSIKNNELIQALVNWISYILLSDEQFVFKTETNPENYIGDTYSKIQYISDAKKKRGDNKINRKRHLF